jgi:CRP/FNR family transcriptional regulator, cyclic AMP receptor protein
LRSPASPEHAVTSPTDTIASLLAQTELFGTLAPNALEQIASRFHTTQFKRGQTIYERGDAGNALYLIRSGQIRFSVVSGEGRELSVRMAKAGEVIGEIAVLDRQPRTATAVALTAVTAHSLSRTELDRLLLQEPQFARNAIDFLCHRLRDTTDQLELIALYPVEVRLARFLLVALKGQSGPSGKRIPLELGFSQGELAQLLGASRPKVNLALGLLEEAGAIGRTSDRLFCDPAVLARIAEKTDD